jgi:hypothetical protein
LIMNAYTRVLVYVGALTVGLAQVAQAQAQQAPSSQQQAAQQSAPAAGAAKETVSSADVTDQEVEQFARSYEDVSRIQKESEKQLQSVQDDSATARVKQEVNQKMAAAVESHGLKVERFNLIARSLNEDPTLQQRVQQKIQELRQAA